MTGDADLPSLSYSEALAELEAILDELDGDEVDVDRLGAQVARAADLIRLCRERVSEARLSIESIVAEVAESPTDAGEP